MLLKLSKKIKKSISVEENAIIGQPFVDDCDYCKSYYNKHLSNTEAMNSKEPQEDIENLTTDVTTFCSLNNSNPDFNLDECSEGDLVFKVNTKWLMDKINSDRRFFPFDTKPFTIDTLELLEKWKNIYTHQEGEYIYRDAIKENVIIGQPSVVDCDYCSNTVHINKYTFKKSICEQYEIKLDKYNSMTFTIDNTGLFQAHGSYGTYAFKWKYYDEETFKNFIIELSKDPDYFLSRITKRNYFYAEKTEEEWKKRIIFDRRGKDFESIKLTQEEARELWEIINSIDYSSADRCQSELFHHKIVWDKYSTPWDCFETVEGYSPDAKYLAEKVMPIFADILKNELASKIK